MRVCKYHSNTHSTRKSSPLKLQENVLTGNLPTAFQSGSIFFYDGAIKHKRASNRWKMRKTLHTPRGSRSKSKVHRLYFLPKVNLFWKVFPRDSRHKSFSGSFLNPNLMKVWEHLKILRKSSFLIYEKQFRKLLKNFWTENNEWN